jgi:3-oxoacyl-[acyl-carrier protein] reductase
MLPAALSLEGRVALVTGAGSPDGIGFASALLLGRLGAAVAVTATSDRVRDRAAELRESGTTAMAVVADLTDADQAADAVAEVAAALGDPTVLVNNAGMTSVSPGDVPESGTVATLSLASWQQSLARNLDTAFLTTRAVLPGMARARWGRIVMVASVTGPVMAMRG